MIDNSFHIITFGCQMNVHDSQWLARALEARGFCEAPLEEARVVVVNTCSVREKPEQKVMSTLGRIRQVTGNSPRVLVAVTGCVAQQLGEKLFSRQVRLVAGSDGISGAPQAIERLLDEPALRLSLLDFTSHYVEREPGADTPSAPVGFVNIMQGCDNFCAYCIVPYTRGRERSRDPETILAEVRTLFGNGYREVTLLGQNVNSYRFGEVDFPGLMRRVASVSPLLRVRFATSHPKDISDSLLEVMAEMPNICRAIHLPAQSGASSMLARMNRKYTREWYLDRVAAIRRYLPDCAVTTDLIAGFSGETEEEHAATLSLMREVGYEFAYMFKYSERPGTYAHKHLSDDVPEEVKSARLAEIIALQNELSRASNLRDVGREFEVLVEGTSKRDENQLSGRTSQNKVVVFDRGGHGVGDYVRVRITGCTPATLFGEEISEG